jgi:hypothetical protein
MDWSILFWIIGLMAIGVAIFWFNPSIEIINTKNEETDEKERFLIIWYSHIKWRNYIRIKLFW